MQSSSALNCRPAYKCNTEARQARQAHKLERLYGFHVVFAKGQFRSRVSLFELRRRTLRNSGSCYIVLTAHSLTTDSWCNAILRLPSAGTILAVKGAGDDFVIPRAIYFPPNPRSKNESEISALIKILTESIIASTCARARVCIHCHVRESCRNLANPLNRARLISLFPDRLMCGNFTATLQHELQQR